MSTSQFELTYLDGDKLGEVVGLQDQEMTIGRSRSNNVVLADDALVSRRHLRITVSDDIVMVHDLDSSHGSFLNDKRIRGSVSLNPGDVLQIGNTRFRFSAPMDSEEEPRTVFADASKEQPRDSDATQFANVSSAGGEETAFAPQMDQAEEDDSMDHTRVFAADETRIMEGTELKGLRAGAAPQKSKKKLMVGVVLLLVIVALAAVMMPDDDDTTGSAIGRATRSYHEKQFGFRVKLPDGWKRASGAEGVLLSFRKSLSSGTEPLQANVYVDRDSSFAITGLQAGFADYEEVLEQRHAKIRLMGSKAVTLAARSAKPVRAIHFGFESENLKGLGMFLFDDTRRICIECTAGKNQIKQYTVSLNNILASITLDEPQRYIDFDMPDRNIVHLSLSNPAGLRQKAMHSLKLGEELLENRMVRQENLYLSIQSLKSSLTMAFALSDRPDFYKRAGEKLLFAITALDRAVRDQKLAIKSAESAQDFENAHWEAVKLTQLVPDKTSDTYQFAAARIRRYSKIKKR